MKLFFTIVRSVILLPMLSYAVTAVAQKDQQLSGAEVNCIAIHKRLAACAESGNNDSALILCRKAILLSEDAMKTEKDTSVRRRLKQLYALSFFKMGKLRVAGQDYDLALKHFSASKALRRSLSEHKEEAAMMSLIAFIYKERGDYTRGLEEEFAAFHLYKSIHHTMGMAGCYVNLGHNYSTLKHYDKAQYYYNRALALSRIKGNKALEAHVLNGLGSMFDYKDEYAPALYYYVKSLDLQKALGNRRSVANVMGNIGCALSNMGKKDTALVYFLGAKKILDSLGLQNSMCFLYANIGSTYLDLKRHKEAREYLERSLRLGEKINARDGISRAHEHLSSLYSETGDKERALRHYRLHISYRDSIFNEETRKKAVQQEYKFAYDKKAIADSLKVADERKISEARLLLAQEKLEKESAKKKLLYGGLTAMTLTGLYVYSRLRLIKRQKLIIEEQERETRMQNKVISEQKKLVEEKQKDIMDSIFYARRIQLSLMTSERYIERQFSKAKGLSLSETTPSEKTY